MSSTARRRLFLRLSALSDDEYPICLNALKDILDIDNDEDDRDGMKTLSEKEELAMEGREIGVGEVRGWMKGRFRDVKPSDIDKVCV